jgi:hypothetical protein
MLEIGDPLASHPFQYGPRDRRLAGPRSPGDPDEDWLHGSYYTTIQVNRHFSPAVKPEPVFSRRTKKAIDNRS